MEQEQQRHCPNCGATAASNQPGRYCSVCGQDNSVGRLKSKAVLLDAAHNFLGWDSALGHTLHGLATNPGQLVSDYVSGKRRYFVNPARFCLLSLALWFFAMHLAGFDPMKVSGIEISGDGGSGTPSSVAVEVRDFLSSNLQLLQYMSLPFLAAFLRAFFRKSGRNLAECLVLVLYLVGFRYLVTTLTVPFTASFPELLAIARVLLGPVFLVWGAWGFFQMGFWSTLWRVALSVALHMLATVIFFGAVAIPWVLLVRA